MSQLPYLAVIVDLDRTLLRTDKSISDYTLGVLRDWQQAGAYLFAATARPERAIADYRRMIDFQAVTTLNGAREIRDIVDRVLNNVYQRALSAGLLDREKTANGAEIGLNAEGIPEIRR